ncbi:MAG: rod shape-determining protein RodA [Candidatus Brocadiae bacterium]|nr:rod shape-determining protein RodA [Candidatus Brocadiia bacterium]
MNLSAKLLSPSLPIVIPALLLLAAGLASIWEAAPVVLPGTGGFHAVASVALRSFFGKQCVAAGIGILLATLVSRVRPQRLRAAGYSLYGSCLGILLVLFILGRVRNGARSWFVIGPVSIQPSEFMKLFFVLTLARYLMWRRAPDRLPRLIAPALLAGVPFSIILLQPDLGTALIFPAMFVAMMWVAGIRKRHLLMGVLAVAILAPLAYAFAFKDYQKKRFQAFLNPQAMSQDAGFQLLQSQKAISSGGWLGRGWGESEQEGPEAFVPERHNDFIFSVIGEEWGLVGASAVLGLYFTLLMAMVLGAYRAREPFGRMVLTGLAAGFATQIFVNIGMTIGVAPITGITLPLLSYGGSSMVATLLSIGVAWNIASQPALTLAGKDFREGAGEVRDLGTDGWSR